eukprot:4201362-Karenia_brevis.AAC.1
MAGMVKPLLAELHAATNLSTHSTARQQSGNTPKQEMQCFDTAAPLMGAQSPAEQDRFQEVDFATTLS